MDLFDGLERKAVKKGTILLQKGEIRNMGFKVLKGCLRSYVIDNYGKEHTLQFAPSDWIIGDIDSLINNKPANLFIDAINDSEIILIPFKTMDDLDPILLKDINYKLLRNMAASHNRLINLLCASSEERYLSFIETYPALIQMVPLKIIASYLGMTPEYLSDVRRRLAQK
jgi:CRP-like cAMP-binding protein